MFNPFSLENKRILITGASSGIGAATAIACANLGAKLIITGRNLERLEDTFSKLEGTGHQKIVLDLLDSYEMEQFVSNLPRFDGVVHAAGIIKTLLFKFVTENLVNELMSINFTSPVLLTKFLIKNKRLNSNGSIVFVSSMAGIYNGAIGNSLYSATKGAIHGMIKTLALELSPQKIRVNSVNPGMIETPLLSCFNLTNDQLQADKDRYPLGRYGTPEEVAYAILYLLSNASSFTTGSNLLIDGGYQLK